MIIPFLLKQWTKATHIRLQLRKVKTLLTDLLPLAREDPTVTRRVSISRYNNNYWVQIH